MRYNLTSLQIFVAIAEERNLTRAATRCHLAPSALSKRIAELEQQANGPLFVRSTRGMSLTPAGQSMLHYARRLFSTMQEMEDELHSYSAGVRGHIRIHAITSALGQFLPEDLNRFTTAYPLVRLDIEERVGSAIVRSVEDGTADVGIFTRETPAPALQLLPYRADQLVMVVPLGHPLLTMAHATFADALQYAFIGPHHDSSLHALLDRQAAALGAPLRQLVRISSFDCMCRMIACGMGIAVLPQGIVAQQRQSLPITCLPLVEDWSRRELVLGVRDLASLSAVSKSLIEQLGGDTQA